MPSGLGLPSPPQFCKEGKLVLRNLWPRVEDYIHHFFPGLHCFHPNFHLQLVGVENLMETQQLMEAQAMYLLENHMEDHQTK